MKQAGATERRLKAAHDRRGVPRASAVVAIALTAIVVFAPRVPAATYYVRASGDDAHDGLTPETALATLRRTGLLLRNPGDRAIVGPGTYREGNIQPHGDGAPDAPILFFADETGMLTGDRAGPVRLVPPN